MEDANEGMALNVQDIDAYWLDRKISQAYDEIDPQHSQKMAEDVLKILEGEGDDQDVETRLVMLLDYDKFNLIKLLLRNRPKVMWCTRLARAEDPEQRKSIKEEMAAAGPSLAGILEQLHATWASAKERQKNPEKSIREVYTGDDRDRDRRIVDREVYTGWLKGQRQLLDLDNIALHQGDLLMANKKCVLPPDSFRNPHKGYEEVFVPALKQKPLTEGEELIKISMMPDWAQLNRVQSKVYETALFTPENILLCAPTGAGKTNVAMLAILHQIGLYRRDGELHNTKHKIVYVAPMKALVAEVVQNLSTRLQSYNIVVKELSGDQTLTRQQIEETQIIVTTPEKWFKTS